jgi:uncharacterized protein (TIGR02271 family)
MPIAGKQGSIVTADGVRGTFKQLTQDGDSEPLVQVTFKGRNPIFVPASLPQRQRGNTYRLPLRFEELTHADNIVAVLPVVSEELRVHKRQVVTGGVRINKRVRRETQVVDEPLFKEEVEIRRVPINRFLDAPVSIRSEGDATIIPLCEERLVIEKRLFLREELVIRKRRSEHHRPKRFTRRSEQVEIQKLDAKGKVKNPSRKSK